MVNLELDKVQWGIYEGWDPWPKFVCSPFPSPPKSCEYFIEASFGWDGKEKLAKMILKILFIVFIKPIYDNKVKKLTFNYI